MVYRGPSLKIWDGVTNSLYNAHKLTGIVIFFLVLARLGYRLTQGAPADEPSLETWQKGASHATHWSLYLLLLLVPIGGYLGISLYPALDVFGIPLPSIVAANQAAAARVFSALGRCRPLSCYWSVRTSVLRSITTLFARMVYCSGCGLGPTGASS